MSREFASFLSLLACPDCRSPLQFQPEGAADGWLRCSGCAAATPVLDGMVLFTETVAAASGSEQLQLLSQSLFASSEDYLGYAEEKQRRNLVDAYAAFEPFNEAGRCGWPLFAAAGEQGEMHGAVLDLGIRSGWSGAMLAGIFPHRKVISVAWTGSGVLGYRGFRHWFGGARATPNLLVVFSQMDRPLPVRAGAFALVHSHDCLHRAEPAFLFKEAFRAGSVDSVAVHAHIHLSDSEPQPFFERGGVHRSLQEYRRLLTELLADDDRSASVLAETPLFEALLDGGADWEALAGKGGYNGIAIVASAAVRARARKLAATPPAPGVESRLIANPFLRINSLTGAVCVDGSALGGAAVQMLERHPPFALRLRKVLPARIDASAMRVLRLAEAGGTLAQISEQAALPIDEVVAIADSLARSEVARVAAMPASYHELHRFHVNQRSVFDPDLLRVLLEWAQAAPEAAGGVLMGGEITRLEAVAVVAALVRYFGSLPLAVGETVELRATGEDSLWPLIACLALGARPSPACETVPRIAITDRPGGGKWQHELCVGAEPDAPCTKLADVLAAYADIECELDLAREAVDCRFAADWNEVLGLDPRGRLQRRG